ncbi:MAG: hypothetical protein LBB09_01790, partial [Rickettsiales bacterium]|nr:hypothetical protein [Rickettsiales bacterium]
KTAGWRRGAVRRGGNGAGRIRIDEVLGGFLMFLASNNFLFLSALNQILSVAARTLIIKRKNFFED